MKVKKATADTIVGLFVIAGFVVLQLFTFLIRQDLFGGTISISATFDSVSGLEVGSPVLVSGVRGGRVSAIQYDPGKAPAADGAPAQDIVVRMVVKDDIPIYENARIKLVQQGFIGDKKVEIDPGTREGGALVSKGHVFRGTPNFDMEKVMKQAGAVVEDLQAAVASIREFATDDQNIRSIRETLANMNESLDKLHDYLVTNEENVTVTVANVREITEELKTFSAQANTYFDEGGRVDRVAATAEGILADFRRDSQELAAKARETVDSINQVVARLDTRTEGVSESAVRLMDSARDDVRALRDNLEATTENLDVILGRMRRGEGTVGRLMTDPKPFEDLKASVETLRLILSGKESRIYDIEIPYEMPAGTP